jgi:hypothetical protein
VDREGRIKTSMGRQRGFLYAGELRAPWSKIPLFLHANILSGPHGKK